MKKSRITILSIIKRVLSVSLSACIFVTAAAQQAQIFPLGQTGNNSGQWYKVGTLTLAQYGEDAVLRVVSGTGYNGSSSQNGESFIHFRTSNAQDANDFAGFYGAADFYNTGKSKLIAGLKINQVTQSSWDFYFQLPPFTGDGSYIVFESGQGTWASSFVKTVSPPGVTVVEGMNIASPVIFSTSPVFSGNVGIGTATPTQKLSVDGNINAKEVIVTTSGWPDYVFKKGYELPSLESLSAQIKTDGHLPDMPSAEEVAANGQSLGEMNKKLLQKVEELTLYIIQQDKKLSEQQQQNRSAEKELNELKTTVEALKTQNRQILSFIQKSR